MNIKPLIAKLLRREELNALERAEVEQFDPDALQTKLDELERAKLSREEALQQDLAAAESERDRLRAECGALIRRERIHAIAAEAGCTEPEYLDFLASRRAVALEDPEAVKSFVAEVERDNPHCFRSRLRRGLSLKHRFFRRIFRGRRDDNPENRRRSAHEQRSFCPVIFFHELFSPF